MEPNSRQMTSLKKREREKKGGNKGSKDKQWVKSERGCAILFIAHLLFLSQYRRKLKGFYDNTKTVCFKEWVNFWWCNRPRVNHVNCFILFFQFFLLNDIWIIFFAVRFPRTWQLTKVIYLCIRKRFTCVIFLIFPDKFIKMSSDR